MIVSKGLGPGPSLNTFGLGPISSLISVGFQQICNFGLQIKQNCTYAFIITKEALFDLER